MDTANDDAMVRLAKSVIEEVLTGAVSECQQAVDQALAALLTAQEQLGTADRSLRAWRRSGQLDYSTGMRALQAAQLADFVTSAVPPGTYPKAVADFLKAHPPTWNVPAASVGPLRTLGQRSTVAAAAVRQILQTPRRLKRR